MNLVLVTVFLGTMTVTSYRSVPSQTDSSPWITSIGERVHPHGVAVSRDLLKKNGGPLNYGDTIYVQGYGFKVVNDVMHKRYKRHIDLWVSTYSQEHRIGVRTKDIWLIIPTLEEAIKCQRPMTKLERIVTRAKELLGALKKMIY
jgi:3D (Asp-Asp-Asp) domain-containing protein